MASLYAVAQSLSRETGIAEIRILDDERHTLFERSTPQAPLNWLTRLLVGEKLAEQRIAVDLVFADNGRGLMETTLSLNPLNSVIVNLIWLGSFMLIGTLLISGLLAYHLLGGHPPSARCPDTNGARYRPRKPNAEIQTDRLPLS